MSYSRPILILAGVLVMVACSESQPVKITEKISSESTESVGIFSSLNNETVNTLSQCEVDAAEFERLMSLSYRDFDQDFSGGWRKVSSNEGCDKAGQLIIEHYILYSTKYLPGELKYLRWHAGQQAAEYGNYQSAIGYFKTTLKNTEVQALNESELLWQLYVQGSIAFLERDKDKLQGIHDQLAVIPVSDEEQAARRKFLEDNPHITMPDGFVEKPQNLSVLERLLECYEYEYKVAYHGNC